MEIARVGLEAFPPGAADWISKILAAQAARSEILPYFVGHIPRDNPDDPARATVALLRDEMARGMLHFFATAPLADGGPGGVILDYSHFEGPRGDPLRLKEANTIGTPLGFVHLGAKFGGPNGWRPGEQVSPARLIPSVRGGAVLSLLANTPYDLTGSFFPLHS